MSNTLLNKLKTIEASRDNLETIIKAKGIDPVSNSFDSLIAEVGRLNYYDNITPQTWTGITPEPMPQDYYTGDDDWKALINPDTIMQEDTYDYNGKIFILLRMSDNLGLDTASNVYIYNYFNGGSYSAVRFSDNPETLVTNFSTYKTWDKTKDYIDTTTHERFRWMILYISKSTPSTTYPLGSNVFTFDSRYILPEWIKVYQGSYLSITYQPADSWTVIRNKSYQADTRNNTGTLYSYGASKCPKYFEIADEVKTEYVYGSSNSNTNYTDYRLRTLLINGTVTRGICGYCNCYNLELFYLKKFEPIDEYLYDWSNICTHFANISNSNIRTWIYLSKIGRLGYLESLDNCYIQIDEVDYIDYTFNSSRNCSLKINKIKYDIPNNYLSSSYKDLIEIGSVRSIGYSAFQRYL